MRQSAASKKLEEYAKGVEGTHDAFIGFMGRAPQRHGIDEEMLAYVESGKRSYDDIMLFYCELAFKRDKQES